MSMVEGQYAQSRFRQLAGYYDAVVQVYGTHDCEWQVNKKKKTNANANSYRPENSLVLDQHSHNINSSLSVFDFL